MKNIVLVVLMLLLSKVLFADNYDCKKFELGLYLFDNYKVSYNPIRTVSFDKKSPKLLSFVAKVDTFERNSWVQFENGLKFKWFIDNKDGFTVPMDDITDLLKSKNALLNSEERKSIDRFLQHDLDEVYLEPSISGERSSYAGKDTFLINGSDDLSYDTLQFVYKYADCK